MAFDIGFDIRNTLAYVTDPAGCFFVNVGMNYPDSSDFGGVTTAGWSPGLNNGSFSDGSNSVDPRLAGRAFVTNGFSSYMQFRIDLPSTGQYSIVCALGDPVGGGWTQYLMLTDGASGGTVFATQSGVAVASGFMDASGNIWSTATFFANQVPVVHTFSTTSLLVTVGDTGGAGFSSLSHIRVTAVASGPPQGWRSQSDQPQNNIEIVSY